MITVALAVTACRAGFSIYFTTLDCGRGRLPPLSPEKPNMVFQFVSRRYERGSTIVTSNKSFDEWRKVLGEAVVAHPIPDHLPHHCDVLYPQWPLLQLFLHQDQTLTP